MVQDKPKEKSVSNVIIFQPPKDLMRGMSQIWSIALGVQQKVDMRSEEGWSKEPSSQADASRLDGLFYGGPADDEVRPSSYDNAHQMRTLLEKRETCSKFLLMN